MKFKDQFRFVRQNMKKNKTRLFMTILATAMGCTFLIVLASVGFGLHKSIIQDQMEARLVTQIDVHGKNDGDGNYAPSTDQDIAYFEAIDHVKAVTPRQLLEQYPLFKVGDYSTNSETFVAHFPSEMKAGFELSGGDLPKAADEIIIGSDFILSGDVPEGEDPYNEDGSMKKQYVYKGELLNETIEMEVIRNEKGEETTLTIPLKIVGISKAPAREWMKDRTVFISQEVLLNIEEFTGNRGGSSEVLEEETAQDLGTERTYNQVKIYARDLQTVTDITEQLKADQYMVYSIANEMKQINMLFTIMKIGLMFIGTIAIIIASIGIYNTMTMAVTERAPDIGIMKAIGANPKTIKNIFLLESSYIGLLGALIGTVVAYGISYIVNFAMPLVLANVFNETPPDGLMLSYIPLSLTAISIAICLVVTIFSGWRPAQRATRVDVLKAMRREI